MSPHGRLNVFQRLARTWDTVHPYNAAQACCVGAAFARSDMTNSWTVALQYLGLESSGREADVDDLPERADLSRHFSRELNRPFLNPAEPPFRPFTLRSQRSTWLGIVYQHWVADSVSIRGLLRAWLAALGATAPEQFPPAPQLACRSRDVIAGWRGNGRMDETVLSLLRRYGEYRRVRKVPTFGSLDHPVRVRLFPGPPGALPKLLAYARARGVTLNDVLLAALAQPCNHLIPAQQRPGRDNLALSTVADLRPGLAASLQPGFGCLLGFTATVCRRRDLSQWDRLLRSVAAQTRVQRRGGVGPASVLWMLAAESASRYTPPNRVYDFYRKEIPLAAGISNVNLNDTWAAGPPVLDYARVSPTGPIVPVALAVTSLGTELRLTLTYRTALLNDWTATELMQSFTSHLQRLAS